MGDMGSDRGSFRGGALSLVLALTLCGCAPVMQYIDEAPSQLQLQNAPAPPTVTNLKIENGKGDVLYNGPRPDDGRVEARPTPAQLDGTLKITRSLSDGTVRDQTLTYEAGKPVKVEYDYLNNKYYVDTSNPPGMPKVYGRLTPNLEFRNRPDTAIIRREDNVSGKILDLIKADNSSSGPGFNGTVGLRFDQSLLGLGKKWGLELN
ncbi:MAG: hypothetical protein WCF16_11055, partial [Alphaproteobacteria bacterium]